MRAQLAPAPASVETLRQVVYGIAAGHTAHITYAPHTDYTVVIVGPRTNETRYFCTLQSCLSVVPSHARDSADLRHRLRVLRLQHHAPVSFEEAGR